jgi:hypothetical protein
VGDNAELLAAYEAVLRAGDLTAQTDLVDRYATDDFAAEWPQSGSVSPGRRPSAWRSTRR